jgi:predicted phosphoribosyltransferase
VIFDDRVEAGVLLGEGLKERFGAASGPDAVVFGIPRGGVIVAAEVARILDAPLDVIVPRKIRAPSNPELGLGAVAPGVEVLDERLVRSLRVSPDYLRREIERAEIEIARRETAYRRDRPAANVRGKIALVVDDGIATGGTAVAALRWARAQGASTTVIAAPVAPASVRPLFLREADEIVFLSEPEPFVAVGRWYRNFDQTSDEEVVAALSGAVNPAS